MSLASMVVPQSSVDSSLSARLSLCLFCLSVCPGPRTRLEGAFGVHSKRKVVAQNMLAESQKTPFQRTE